MNEEIVLQKVKEIFGPEEFERVLEALSEYGKEDHEGEIHRVRLGILKMSFGKLSSIGELIQIAKQDYRDIIAWAEYPEQTKMGASTINTEKSKLQKITESDRKQYLNWLKGSCR